MNDITDTGPSEKCTGCHKKYKLRCIGDTTSDLWAVFPSADLIEFLGVETAHPAPGCALFEAALAGANLLL